MSIEELDVNDTLQLKDNSIVVIENKIIFPTFVEVYNLEIEDNENYYVTEEGVLVHNECEGNNTGNKEETTGGAYKDLDYDPELHQRHHMPSQKSGNKGATGGAITIEIEDHKLTGSFNNKPGSSDYRKMQEELVKQGKFGEALQMDIDDITTKFPGKYDDAIKQLKEWYKSIGKI